MIGIVSNHNFTTQKSTSYNQWQWHALTACSPAQHSTVSCNVNIKLLPKTLNNNNRTYYVFKI